MPKLRHTCVFLLAATVVVISAIAQTGTGTLRGTMTDDSGGVTPANAAATSVVTLSGSSGRSHVEALRG